MIPLDSKKRVFSGLRPTGRMHLGNYLGAIRNWVAMQETRDCVYGVVDYHAITTPFDPDELRTDVREMVIDLLAVGVDPEKSALIIQSQLPEHTELAWILGAVTPISWLERVPTYKEKAEMHPDYLHLGLLSYPVLMAADILLYRANEVPVGEDQLPHIELTREIVRRFNHMFGDTFEEPKAFLHKDSARIMSLSDPEKKMSKSLGPDSYIALADEPDVIRKKIRKAVTDIGPANEKMSPGVGNLFRLLQLVGGEDDHASLWSDYESGSLRYVDLKDATAEAIIAFLAPIRANRQRFAADEQVLRNAVEKGRELAASMAEDTMAAVRTRLGVGQ